MGLSLRLKKIADMIDNGSVVADIGTDHGLLPVYLMRRSKSEAVIASDIRKAPFEKARACIERSGTGKYIQTVLTAGLEGMLIDSLSHIIIAGMGGETISKILLNGDGSADFDPVVYKNRKFIMQPMTRAYELRLFLTENGFFIKSETLVKDSGRIYKIMEAEYDGMRREKDRFYLCYGDVEGYTDEGLKKEYIAREMKKVEKMLSGLKKIVDPDADMKESIAEAEMFLERLRGYLPI